jgi:uncharacterized protein YbjT (DUF2867 family)
MTLDGITAVAGSLGDQGGAVARAVRRTGGAVVALSRNPESPAAEELHELGVDVRHDDLDDADTVTRQLAPARRLFGALTPFDEGGLEAEQRQVRNLAEAAEHAGLERVIYSAVGDPEEDRDVSAQAIWGIERLIQQAGLPLTLVRPAFFMENLDEFALRWDGEEGVRTSSREVLTLSLPLRESTTVQWIAVDDVGELVRLAFSRPDAFGPGPVQLAADELTLGEALRLIGDVLDVPVRYHQISLDEVHDRHAHGMYRWFRSYAHYHADVEGLRRLSPELRTFRQWLERGGLDQSKFERREAA